MPQTWRKDDNYHGCWNRESNLKVVQRGCIVCKRSSGEMVRLFGGNSFDALFFWIFRCFWTPPNTSRWIRTLRATGWWENMRWSWNWNMSQIFSRSVQTNESSVSLLSKVVSFSCIKSCQFPFFQKLSVSLVSKVVISSCIKSCQFLLCQKLLVSLVSKVVSFSCIKSC